MTNPQQPELARSRKGATSDDSAKAHVGGPRAGQSSDGPDGPIPEENLPGHHPEVEQDKPTGPPPAPRRRRLEAAPKLDSERFDFRFEPVMRALALPFGVRPSNAWVEVDVDEVHIAFGPWHMRFPR